MKIRINYIPPNWNKYIDLERSNMFASNNLKQKEKKIAKIKKSGQRRSLHIILHKF